MGRTVFQYQTMSAPATAEISMDGLRKNRNDRPVFGTATQPMPILHSDFGFSLRDIMESRNNNTPLDTSMAEDCGIRVAELAERLHLGTQSSYTYGGGTIYGLTNFPQRLTYVMSDPTLAGWTPNMTMLDVVAMCQASRDNFHMGPWRLYTSHSWAQYLDQDYTAAYGMQTLRSRLEMLSGIEEVVTLDFLTDYQMVLVEMKNRTIRTIIGLDITTLQWPSEGGMEINFKVMQIIAPQPRAD
jgi:hypothetical protein